MGTIQVKCLASSNIDITQNQRNLVLDGYYIIANDLVFLLKQTNPYERAIWQMQVDGSLKRFARGVDAGDTVLVMQGAHCGQLYRWNPYLQMWILQVGSSDGYISWNEVIGTPTTLAGYGITDGVTTARKVNTISPILGGGALDHDLTLSLGTISDGYISGLSWSKITGTPTTLGGYGITDGTTKTYVDGYFITRHVNTNAPFVGGGSLASDLTLGLSLGAANTVMASDGSTDDWTTNPVVTTIRGNTAVYAGTTGAFATLQPSLLGFTPGNATISLLGSLTFTNMGTPYVALSFPSSVGHIDFDSSVVGAVLDIASSTTASTGATLNIAAQSSSAYLCTGGALNLSSGSGIVFAGNVNISCGSTAYITCDPTGIGIHNYRLYNVSDPQAPQDAATKHYVDSIAVGTGANYTALVSYGGRAGWGKISDGYISSVDWSKLGSSAPIKLVATVVATSNISLTGAGITIDGITVAAGQRILCVAQTAPVQNGLWIAGIGSCFRPSDFASGQAANGCVVYINQGTTYASSAWVCTNVVNVGADTIDTMDLSFAQLNITSLAWSKLTGVPDATTSQKGIVQLAGDLAGSATSVSVAKIKGTAIITAGGSLPTGLCLTSVSTTQCDWNYLTNININTGANIDPSKLTIGSANTVLTANGSANSWGSVTNAMLAGSIAWSKLTGYPTITCTAPLTIGGGSSADLSTNRTLAVQNCSTIGVGVVQLSQDLGGTATAPTVLNITGSSNIANCLPALSVSDISLQGAPASGKELLQAYSGQLVSRQGAGYLDYAVSPVNGNASATAAPKINKYVRHYQVSSQTSNSYTIPVAVAGQTMPANRVFYGNLVIVQRVDATATWGWAGTFLIEGTSDGSGNITAVAIVQTGTVGPAATPPSITVQQLGNTTFQLTINNGSTVGAITGMFKIEIGWCS